MFLLIASLEAFLLKFLNTLTKLHKKILLFGPYIGNLKNAYGGGTGGYTRNMLVYIHNYKDKSFEQVPFFHTVRGQLKFDFFILRFLIDIFKYFFSLLKVKPRGIHILAQYRTATPREFAVILIANLFRIPVLYEQKAGAFIWWYKSTNSMFKWMARYCLNKSKIVLTEGLPHQDFLKKEFNIDAGYFPNFVPDSEVPNSEPALLKESTINILFVGYCYRGKGIFELVEGCNIAAKKEKVVLTIIGHEHEEFTSWVDAFPIHENLKINRLGKQPHDVVIDNFKVNDIYCYPTSHKGEGHNNTINEAMMMGLIIITTRNGFLGTILSDDRAYFLNEITDQDIAETIQSIADNKIVARQKASASKNYLKKHFLSSVAFDKLSNYYEKLIKA